MEAVATAPKLPKTLDDLQANEILRIPATWEEYLDLVETTPYTIHYFSEEIIIMGQATETHERLVARLIKLFALYFDELDDCRVLSSNIKIVIPNQVGDFNADLSMVRGPSEYGLTPSGQPSTVRICNPEIVVEVFSKSTEPFDRGGKMLAYQSIPSLQHILMVSQQQVSVWICSRTQQPNQWLLTNYTNQSDQIQIGNFTLSLSDVYRKIDLAS